MDNRKKIIIKISAVFVCLILFLGFFSTTIYNFGLASVTIGFPEEGMPTRTLRAHGTVMLNTVFGSFAPIDGIITMNRSAGEIINAGTPLYTITPEDGGEPVDVSYEFNLAISEFYTETNAYVNKHDKIMQVGRVNGKYYTELVLEHDNDITQRNSTFWITAPELVAGTSMIGEVRTVITRDGVKIAKTHFDGSNLTGGEYLEAHATFSAGLQNIVVPNTAIRSESFADLGSDSTSESTTHNYVYVVVRQKGAFGYDYIVQKQYVASAFKGDTSSALYGEINYPIIINSDRPIEVGQRVKITDGSDYVEIR